MPKGKEQAEKEGGTQGHQERKRGYWNREGPPGQKEGLTEHGEEHQDERRGYQDMGGTSRTGGAIRTWEELAGKEGD